MKTLDQIRAQYAWDRVQNPSKEYNNLAKSLPAMIMSNGFMQTLAFLKGKGKDEHARLLGDILDWLCDENAKVFPPGCREFKGAMSHLTQKVDALQYQRATEEAMAVLRWIRYLAQTLV